MSNNTSTKDLKSSTKKNLKTMQRSKKRHIVRKEARIIKYGAISFARNIWLTVAATLVMTITLIILFATTITSVILNDTANSMRDKIDITIYFKPGTSDEALNKMSDTISKDSNIKSVEISTSENELDNVLKDNENNQELLEILKDEEMRKIMLSGMQATMRIKVNNIDDIDSIRDIVNTDADFIKNIEDDPEKAPTYDANKNEIHTIVSWANIARNGGVILSVIFLAISVLIIFNTIRMAIFSRREEIYMMKLVGADKGFIKGPFLIEAELCGLLSGIVAASLSYAGFNLLSPRLSNFGIDVLRIGEILHSDWLVLVFAGFAVLGIIIGRISAQLAISKYLHKA